MGLLADHFAPKELHEQRGSFHWHGVNFHTTLAEAEALGMDTDFAALTQVLGVYAQNQRDFASADQRFAALAEHWKQCNDPKGEATASLVGEDRRGAARLRGGRAVVSTGAGDQGKAGQRARRGEDLWAVRYYRWAS